MAGIPARVARRLRQRWPPDLLFEIGDPLLALGHRTQRIRDPINLGHQPFKQHIRLKKGH